MRFEHFVRAPFTRDAKFSRPDPLAALDSRPGQIMIRNEERRAIQ